MSKKEMIVTFVHSNYLVRQGGTEKFVADLSKVLQDKGYDHLCFFPFVKQKSIRGKKIVGVNYNDKFEGIIESHNMSCTIKYFLKKENAILNSFHIQHLKYHNIKDVIDAISIANVELFIFAHDFYLACCSQHFISSEEVFCGDMPPSDKKCAQCEFYAKEKLHSKQIIEFINLTKEQINCIICPSKYVKDVLRNIYPQLESKIIVRPHLKFECNDDGNLGKIDNQIKLAFLGKKRKSKGYPQWERLISRIPQKIFQLYYLGVDIDKVSDLNQVKQIFVSTTLQGSDAMERSVADNGIECAFVWPQCPETYSFVFYELLMSGVYILTNDISGNIAEEIKKYGNGKIFNSIDDCIHWANNPDRVFEDINRYRLKSKQLPSKSFANPDIQQCVSTNPVVLDRVKGGIMKKQFLSTFMYRIKYSKFRI